MKKEEEIDEFMNKLNFEKFEENFEESIKSNIDNMNLDASILIDERVASIDQNINLEEE